MRYGALALLLAGAFAAVGTPAGATGNNDANPHHTQTRNDSCSAPKGWLGPGRSGEEIPTLTGGRTHPGCFGADEVPAQWTEQWTELEDDTETLSIFVPTTWTAVDLTPGQNKDGTPQPWISATTDEFLFFPPEGTADTFSVPGVVYRAYPLVSDTAAILEASEYHKVCTADPMQTFDDGVYAGHIETFNACGGTASRIVAVAANAPGGAFTSVLLVQLTGQPDDAATLDGLLSSFDQVIDDTIPTTPAPTATPNEAGALQHYVLQEYGWTIDEAQARCLLDQPDLDPLPGGPIVLHLVNCGLDTIDLPSG